MNTDDTERLIEAVELIGELIGRIATSLEAIEATLDAVVVNEGKRSWLRVLQEDAPKPSSRGDD